MPTSPEPGFRADPTRTGQDQFRPIILSALAARVISPNQPRDSHALMAGARHGIWSRGVRVFAHLLAFGRRRARSLLHLERGVFQCWPSTLHPQRRQYRVIKTDGPREIVRADGEVTEHLSALPRLPTIPKSRMHLFAISRSRVRLLQPAPATSARGDLYKRPPLSFSDAAAQSRLPADRRFPDSCPASTG